MSNKRDNVIVFGNGFDIALGLPTQYRDFVNSKYWPIKDLSVFGANTDCLHNFIYNYTLDNKDSLGNVRWIDIEDLLLRYALSKNDSSCILDDVVKSDILTYDLLKKSFVKYIIEVVCKKSIQLKHRPLYVDTILKAIVSNNTFAKLYSFNYTSTSSFLDFYWGCDNLVTHLHGLVNSIEDDIILGINDTVAIPNQYKFLQKSRDEHYSFHDLNDALVLAEHIIFYGISFGPADLIYFKSFFIDTIKNYVPGRTPKKRIDIFTYDESARQAIITSLEDIGIHLSDLYSSTHFTIHKATSQISDNNINSFLNHLKQTTFKEISIVDQYGALYNRPRKFGKGYW